MALNVLNGLCMYVCADKKVAMASADKIACIWHTVYTYAALKEINGNILFA